MTTKITVFFLKTLKFLQRDKDKTQLQPEQSLRAAKRKNKAAVLMVVSISLCVCDISYSAAAISLAWLSFFLAKHWTGPVYSTLAPIEFYRSCPKKSGRTWVCHGEWKTPAQTFEMCYKQELVMQSVALFFPPTPTRIGLAQAGQSATVPGVGRCAGEIGGVGLPESTWGQGRIDRLALPATAQQREETGAEDFNLTGKSFFVVALNG